MARERVGKLAPHYAFLLNPYTDVRLSKCPLCGGLTHPRKFALFIHVKDFGLLVLGKTCRYCTPCELVIAHKDELEAELARSPAHLSPGTAEERYLVVGTVDRRVWKQGLQGTGTQLGEALEHMADFKKHFDLHVEPGGWRPARGNPGS
jgi:hypothetical protein